MLASGQYSEVVVNSNFLTFDSFTTFCHSSLRHWFDNHCLSSQDKNIFFTNSSFLTSFSYRFQIQKQNVRHKMQVSNYNRRKRNEKADFVGLIPQKDMNDRWRLIYVNDFWIVLLTKIMKRKKNLDFFQSICLLLL